MNAITELPMPLKLKVVAVSTFVHVVVGISFCYAHLTLFSSSLIALRGVIGHD